MVPVKFFVFGVPPILLLAALFSGYIPSYIDFDCLEELNWQEDAHECVVRKGIYTTSSVERFSTNSGVVSALVTKPNFGQLKGVVVDVIGGPGDRIDLRGTRNHFVTLVAKIASDGYVVVTPAYAGTYHRNMFPDQSLQSAGREIEQIYNSALKRYRTKNGCLIGTSLGGYIIFDQKNSTLNREFSKSNVILLNPLLSSPKVRYDNANRNTYSIDIDGNSKRIRYRYKSVITYNKDNGKYMDVKILEDELFKSFFGDKFSEPVNLLATPNFNTIVFFSKLDNERTQENMHSYKNLRSAKLVPLNTEKHAISEGENYEDMVYQIASAVSQCAEDIPPSRRGYSSLHR